MSAPQSPDEQIESVKRYVYGVAYAVYGNRHRYAGPAGFTPQPVDFFHLLDLLIDLIHKNRLPVDTQAFRRFAEVEHRRLYGVKGITSSGILFPDKVTADEWREKASNLDDRLNDLKALLPTLGPDTKSVGPWSGSAWDALQDKPRRLLEFMHSRQTSGITNELCQYVWHKDATQVDWTTINSAIHRANDFLTSIAWPKHLSKVRNEDRISWK
jgi:hypothetical protein